MKFARLAIACAVLAAGAAHAQATSNAFSVTVSLTPVCGVKTNASNISFGAYTPFTNGDVTPAATSVVFQCSQGIAPTQIALVNTVGTGTTVSTAGTGAQTAEGVVRGLRYTLAIPSIANALTAGTAGTAATAGAGGTGGTNSTAKEYNFAVTSFMPGAQAGSNTGDTTQSWQVVLTY
jgi:hypothetical protein